MKKTIKKNEVISLIDNLSKKILPLKSVEEVESLVIELAPDVDTIEVNNLDSNHSSEFSISFTIPRIYTGKHSNSEYKKIIGDSFTFFISGDTVALTIWKGLNEFTIEAYAWFKYYTTYNEIEENTINIKENIIQIPLEYRKDEINKLISDIEGLSLEVMSSIIKDAKVGEASFEQKLIDEVRKQFIEFTIKNIEFTEIIPRTIDEAWILFKEQNPIAEIAYSLGYEKSKVIPNYYEWEKTNNKLNDLVKQHKNILENDYQADFKNLDLKTAKNLAYLYLLSELKKGYEENGAEKIHILLDRIDSLLNDSIKLKLYEKYYKKGFKMLEMLQDASI